MRTYVGVQHGQLGRIAIYETSDEMAEHQHATAQLVIKLAGDDRRFGFGTDEVRLTDELAVGIPAFSRHACHALGENKTRLLTIYFAERWLYLFAASNGLALGQVFGRRGLPLGAEALKRIDQIYRVFIETATTPQYARSLDEEVSVLLASLLMSSREADSRILPDRRFTQVTHKIATEKGRISIDVLAKSSGLSRSQLFVLFERELGITPKAYADSVRAEEAFRLIGKMDIPLSQISSDLNFCEHATFTRFMKRFSGVAPRAYRRALLPSLPGC